MLFKSTWTPFKASFETTLEAFREHKKLVEQEANVSEMVESGRARGTANLHFKGIRTMPSERIGHSFASRI